MSPPVASAPHHADPRHRVGIKDAFSPWCSSMGKRVFDLVIAGFLLLMSAPVMLIIAALVKLTSPGPVFFRQLRVGRNGRHFRIFKFRSMVNGCGGLGVTYNNDPRVTPIGKVLRKWKLDELPQLFNVVTGEMSMVGPRPLIPEVLCLPPGDGKFLKLLPGVTGSASVKFCREEESLTNVPPDQWRQYYVSNILPQKLTLELDYASRASLWRDLALILSTPVFVLMPRANGHQAESVPVAISLPVPAPVPPLQQAAGSSEEHRAA